jgi:hypothetical protein
MKKLIILTLVLLNSLIVNGQETVKYVELNTGFSTGAVPFFPGGSLMVGATHKFDSGIILDYEGGVAIPTIITLKGGVGFNIKQDILTFGVRPWPGSVYAQYEIMRPGKSSDIVITAEGSLGVIQSSIFTVGWRWKNKPYKDAFKFKEYK